MSFVNRRVQWLAVLTLLATPTVSFAQSWKNPHNRPPVISGTPATTVVAGSAYTFTPVASDPEGRALTFTIYNRPAWATFSGVTGRLQGTPQIADVGTYGNIIVAVSDGRKTAQLAPFSIVVTTPASNSAPVISGVPAASVTAGSAYAFVPTASDADNHPLTFSVSGPPAWAALD